MPRPRFLRAIARVWWLRIYSVSGSVPSPRDAPAIRSRAEDPDRLLIIGNGAARGWGVTTYGLALAGQLANAVGRLTSRPCDVDQLGDETMNVLSAPLWIGDRSLRGYDTVLVVLGIGDALRQLPAATWREGLERLLDRLRSDLDPAATVVVTGIEPIASARVFSGPFARLGQQHADRLNAVTREVAAERERVRFVPLPASSPKALRDRGATNDYARWAALLADTLVPALAEARSAPSRATTPVLNVTELGAPLRLDGDLTALRSLVEGARTELSGDLAWVGLQVGDRQMVAVSSAGTDPISVPTELMFCKYTIERDETFVVPDVSRDPRFAGNPFLEVLHLESYVGHPLHDAAGAVIGTLCVASIRPKASFSSTGGVLEGYARTAETELVRIGAEEQQAAPAGG